MPVKLPALPKATPAHVPAVPVTSPAPTTSTIDADPPRRPEDVYESLGPAHTSPSHDLHGSFNGWRFDSKDVDDVMKRYGVADVKALLTLAIRLHPSTIRARFLTRDELEAAAQRQGAYVAKGVKFSPSDLADVMRGKGIAEQGAMLRAARRVDDGDKILTRQELETAADLLSSIVKAHDLDEVQRRTAALAAAGDVTIEKLADVGGRSIEAVRVACTNPPPKLRVLVSGGVHGSEPCGTGAAMLVLQEALRSTELRGEVEFTVVPVVNPRGLAHGTRHTPEDVDLNRTFDDAHAPHESSVVRAYMDREKFDCVLDLHAMQADRNGFLLIHQDGGDAARFAMNRFQETWPALSSDPAPYVMSEPGVAESDNRGTLKGAAKQAGAKLAVTVEAPGSLGYFDQVLGEAELVFHLVDSQRV